MPTPLTRWDPVPVFGFYFKGDDSTPVTGEIVLSLTQRVTRVDGRVIYPEGAKVTRKIGDHAADATARDAVRAAWRAADEAAMGADFDGAAWDAWWNVMLTGAVFASFPASDDPDIVQTGYEVKVEEKLHSGQGRVYYIKPLLAHLESTPPGINLGLVEVPPGAPTAPAPIYAKGLPGGVAALDDLGRVVDASGAVVGEVDFTEVEVHVADSLGDLGTPIGVNLANAVDLQVAQSLDDPGTAVGSALPTTIAAQVADSGSNVRAALDVAVADSVGSTQSAVRSSVTALIAESTEPLTVGGKRAVRKDELVFNVKDYGASGDGVANDTASIQSAINAANAAGGGTVHLPTGSYAVTTALTLYSRVIMQGTPGQTRLVVTGTQTTLVAASSRVNAGLRDLALDGNASANLNYLLFVSAGSGLTVERVAFSNIAKANSYGVYLQSANADTTVRDCTFTGMHRGIGLATATKRVHVTRCRFWALNGYGIYGVSSAGSVLEDVTVENCHLSTVGTSGVPGRQPIYFTGGAVGVYALRVRIVENTVLGNSAHYNGGLGNGDMIAAYNLAESEVANNTVLFGGDVGISVWRSKRVTVTGNVCGHNNTNGIVLWEANACTVTGNVCYNNNQNYGAEWTSAQKKGGIRAMVSSAGNVISGNRCYDDQATKTQDYGVVVEGGATPAVDTLVVANNLKGNSVAAVDDLGTTSLVANNLV